MQFIPYDELGDRPNIIVDGAGNAHSVLTLSHWPGSALPDVLKDDLSTQIVFRYLDRPDLWVKADAVSNNHFDEDGLAGIFSLLNPEQAQPHRDLLIDVAAAGDFATYRYRDAARIAFVISAFADRNTSPLDASIFRERYTKIASKLYEEMLPRLPEIVSHIDRFKTYWEPEDARLHESETLMREGKIEIEEIPALDLAIVRLPESLPIRKVHPMAIHNTIQSFRVLLMHGRTYELQYRYETWVQYVSRPLLPRLDLQRLAEDLSELEAGNGRWAFDGIDEITPKLALTGAAESRISPEEFLRRIKACLASGRA